MGQFHDAPDRYLALMRDALPLYDRLQEELVRAGEDLAVARLLDLGVGTGETCRRCAAVHPGVAVVGIDANPEMLAIARVTLGEHADLRLAHLEQPLPEGPFDLVVSALAVHHLDGPDKVSLFRRVRERLAPAGRFVMADVVVAETPVSHPAPLDPTVDRPDRLADLLEWLAWAGLEPDVRWQEQDLAVVCAS